MKLYSRSAAILAGGLMAEILFGCHRGGNSVASQQASLPPATVQVQIVDSKSRIETEDVIGTVRAKLRASIEAKVTGKINKMLAAPGQKVAAGELLAELDAREIQARVDQARAVHQQAEADWKRLAALWDQKVLSQAEYDTAKARFNVAEASLLEVETLLDYTKVTAPFTGIITRKLADVGDLATPGKPLLEMEDSTALRLEADVPEAVVDNVKIGDRLPVRIGSAENSLEGAVSEIAPAADPNSRTFLVKLDLPTASGLRAGQFGRASMPIGKTSALCVPASAVVQRGQLEIVFVAFQSHARLRLVKTGKHIGDEVEIVSGLEAGETIVVAGSDQLRDGQPLSLK